MDIWGTTGTNGKTTTTWVLAEMLRARPGAKVGYVTTVETDTLERKVKSTYTTPPLKELEGYFAEMAAAGATDCAMEVSSHAIHQRRTGGTVFAGGIFTNLSEDHLDYHKTMEAYFEVKADFFRRLAESAPGAPAVVGTDCEWGRRLAAICRTLPLETIPFGLGDSAAGEVEFVRRHSPLVGDYNVRNVLGAAALARAAGVPDATVRSVIPRLTPRWGRLERVATASPAAVYVDFAHTDDALDKVLGAVRTFTKGRVFAVFGAGGDRDRRKRPLMGAAAARRADRLVITSDNPRSEDPEAIIAEIVAGLPAGCDYVTEPDRRRAIFMALGEAAAGDTVVICGKGHETTQTVMGVAHPFDDRLVAAGFTGSRDTARPASRRP